MAFKEYKDTCSVAEDMRAHILEMHDSDSKAFSPEFKKFIESQKPEIAKPLNLISDEGGKQLHAFRTSFNWWTDFLGQDLVNLQNLHSDLIQQQNLLQAKQNEAHKADLAFTKNNENLDKARNKNNPKDIALYESQTPALQKQKDDSHKAADEQQEFYNKYSEEYKSKFLDSFATSLSNLVKGRQTVLAELMTVADNISEAIQTIEEPKDSSIPPLQTRLNDLEAVVIE